MHDHHIAKGWRRTPLPKCSTRSTATCKAVARRQLDTATDPAAHGQSASCNQPATVKLTVDTREASSPELSSMVTFSMLPSITLSLAWMLGWVASSHAATANKLTTAMREANRRVTLRNNKLP